MSVSEGTPMASHEITGFSDQDAGWTATVANSYDSTMDLASNNDSTLGEFLSRPIRAADYSWVVGQPLFQQFNPWSTFITNPRVAEKLANYELLRCKMNMKIVISGTGFHYGRALVSYNPLEGYDDITVERDFFDIDLVQASQKPHFFLNPTNNEGGEMEMPFFFLQNYMSLSKLDYNDMGEVSIKGFDTLKHANGGDDPVTITVYLWASDVVLTMPTSLTETTTFTPQAGSRPNNKSRTQTKKKAKPSNTMNSGDEYGQGIISKPASAIAKAAGMLAEIPMIAPYARATEMVAEKVGMVANLFGYSRPPVVSDILLQKPSPTGNLANTDAADAVNRLTLDSKQEITIDSRTVGLDGQDQMDILGFGKRESYLGQFEMKTTDAPDTILWNSYVTPVLYRQGATGVEGAELHLTPMALLSQYFTSWQGSIKFRFQVVKSNFHKGRILLRWDPRSHGANVSYNTVYSRVVDIAQEDDFEIVIGWGQNRPFLGCPQVTETTEPFFGTTRLPTDSTNDMNGVLELNVVNSLVSPSVDSDIRINVFVSACDDMKWGAPNPDKLRNLHLFPLPGPSAQALAAPSPKDEDGRATEYVPQSGMQATDVSGTTSSETDRPVDVPSIQDVSSTLGEDDHQMEVFFGEAPTSWREILRRYVYTRTWVAPQVGNNQLAVNTLRLKGLPYATGWDPDGIDTAADDTTPLTTGQTHILTLLGPCYAGWRGGLRKKLLFQNSNTSPSATRYGFINAKGWLQNLESTNSLSSDFEKFLSSRNGRFSNGGTAATNLGINNTIEAELPFYNGVRFQSARQPNASFNNGAHSLYVQTVSVQTDVGESFGSAFQDWSAVGEDFTLFFFTGVPIIYRYAVSEVTVPP